MNCTACELEMNHLLCDIPSKWREQLVKVICQHIVTQGIDCKQVYDCMGDAAEQLEPGCLTTPEIWDALPFIGQIQLMIDKICAVTGVLTLHIQDTFSIDLTGDGTVVNPLKGDVRINTITGNNKLAITATGLYVPPLTLTTNGICGVAASYDPVTNILNVPIAPCPIVPPEPLPPQGWQDTLIVDPDLTQNITSNMNGQELIFEIGVGDYVAWSGGLPEKYFGVQINNLAGGYGEIYVNNTYSALYSGTGLPFQNSWVTLQGDNIDLLMTTLTFDTTQFSSGVNYVLTDAAGTGSLTMQPLLPPYIEVTKAELDTHITNSTLSPGTLYKILGVHPDLYNDGVTNLTTVFLKAVSTNKLEPEGVGLFYNPTYPEVPGYNIWDNRNKFTALGPSMVGTFNQFEAITNNLGGTGTLLTTVEDGYFTITGGTWAGATSITGNVSGATVNINSVIVKSFAIGSKTIWGGYVWSNVNGNVGASLTSLELNSEWSKIAYSTTDYTIVMDVIAYSYEDDMITKRYDPISDNTVTFTAGDVPMVGKPNHAISVFQWGNKFTGGLGVGSNKVLNSYVDNINHQGYYFYNNIFDQNSFYEGNTITENAYGVYWCYLKNKSFMTGNVITNGSTIDNMDMSGGASLRNNYITNNSSIFENTMNGAGYIGYNNLLGNTLIRQNNMVGASYIFDLTIRGNSGYAQIYGNSMYRSAYIRNMNIDTRSAGSTAVYPIMNNVMYGGTGNYVIGYNNTTNPSIIGYSTLTGFGQIVENHITSGEISSVNLTNCLLSRNSIRNNGYIKNLVSTGYHTEKLDVISTTADYANVPLTAPSRGAKYSQNDNIYSFTTTFTGAAGAGAIGAVTIENFTIPAGFFLEEVLIDVGAGLTGAGIINLGIDVDGPSSGLNNTNGIVANLNTYGISRFQLGTPGFTKATAVRRLVMSVNTAAVTAGTATFKIKLSKLG